MVLFSGNQSSDSERAAWYGASNAERLTGGYMYGYVIKVCAFTLQIDTPCSPWFLQWSSGFMCVHCDMYMYSNE